MERRAQLLDGDFRSMIPPVAAGEHVAEQVHTRPALFEKIAEQGEPDGASSWPDGVAFVCR
jgi:hypothetical protein